MSLAQKIDAKTAQIAIVGMGYVGLPLALEFAKKGFKVFGIDVDESKCTNLNGGKSYIKHISSETIQTAVERGMLIATSDFSKVKECDAIIICVPTPLTKNRDPDLSFIEITAKNLSPHLHTGQLISLESTTYPATTRNVLVPILEKISGLKASKDFHVVFSPEREDPGNKNFSTRSIPKLVGGLTPDSTALGMKLYQQVVEKVVPVSSPEIAESAKLLENIYRSINIALVNELKVVMHRMGINIWEVIEAAATKPFGFTAFYPGPGLGGHCIPIDPFYLTWKAREFGMSTHFIELAGEINTFMPDYVIQRSFEALNNQGKSVRDSKILLLGIAYKKNVDDPRESPALIIYEKLLKHGAKVDFHDPFIKSLKPNSEHPTLPTSQSVTWSRESLAAYDAVLICTDHDEVDYTLLNSFGGVVIDTRNACKSRNLTVANLELA